MFSISKYFIRVPLSSRSRDKERCLSAPESNLNFENMFRAGNIEVLPRRNICVFFCFFWDRKKIFLRSCERKIRNVRWSILARVNVGSWLTETHSLWTAGYFLTGAIFLRGDPRAEAARSFRTVTLIRARFFNASPIHLRQNQDANFLLARSRREFATRRSFGTTKFSWLRRASFNLSVWH